MDVSRGYARNQRDEARLIKAGVPARCIYRADNPDEAWGNWKMRKGEVLGCVNGLLAFGSSRRDMMRALDRVESWGAIIYDVEEKLRSDKQSAKLLDLGLACRHGERAMKPGQAEKMQALSVEARLKGRMPQREALKHWRDPGLTAATALRLMKGWTRNSAYKVLKKRGVPSGRPQLDQQ